MLANLLLLVVTWYLMVAPQVTTAQLCYRNAVSMRFKPREAGPPYSFLYTANQTDVQMSRSRVFPPVIIQILDSNGNVDYSDSTGDVTIVAQSTTRLAAAGSSVPVVYGEAQFLNLLVEGTDLSYNLTFVATSSSPLLPVANASNPSGKLTVYNVTNLQQPVNVHRLAFARNRSFLLYEGQPLPLVVGQVMPTITLNILNSQYLTFPTGSTLGSNYTCGVASSAPSLLFPSAGGLVPVVDGEAVFDSLVFQSPASVGIVTSSLDFLLFTLYSSGVPTLTVKSGRVSVSSVSVEYAAIGFQRADQSFIGSEGQAAFAQSGTPLPPIRISLRNTMMAESPQSSGLIITATCGVPYPLRGFQVGVVNGIATFANLTFDSRIAGNVVLTFTAGAQGSLPLAGTSIRSGWITVSPVVSPAMTLEFMPNAFDSFLNYPGQKAEVVLFNPIPTIRIRLLDSANNVDTNTIVTVSATASNGILFASASQTTTAGTVEFSSLMFLSSAANTNPRITFTAGGNTTVGVFGRTLATGLISVAAVQSNYGLRFQPYGAGHFVATGVGSVATVNVKLPKIVLELVTSAGAMDSSSSEISVTATAAGAQLSGGFMRASNGQIVFDSLTFVSEVSGNFVLTFTAGMEVPDAPVSGKFITTGTIRVFSSVTPAVGLRFRKDSYIAYYGHVMPITQGQFRAGNLASGSRVPPIFIELIDSAHNVSVAANPITIQCSFSTGTTDGNPNGRQQIMYSGQSFVTFAALAVQSAYSPTMIFTASGTTDAVNGDQIQSGPLTFYTTKAVLGSLSITPTSTVPKERASASVNDGAPMTFGVQLLDSTGQPVTTLLSPAVTISVQSTYALKAPVSVQMNSNGLATFSNLQFTQSLLSSAQPILTFSASTPSSSTPNRLSTISTGTITVIGPSAVSGVDVVAQVLFDYAGFQSSLWVASLARRLNVETSRILLTRVYYGTGADPSPDPLNLTANAVAVWYGTRVDLRFLEPLATSRNVRPAWWLANAFLNLKTDCDSTKSLYLRKTFNLSSDTSCDWYMFEDQMSGAQQCVLSNGERYFCDCYVDLIDTMGLRCLGYRTLTDLCLNTLIGSANCANPRIQAVCGLLNPPPVARLTLLASGIFFAFLLLPLMGLRSNGFFHKLQRPKAHRSFSVLHQHIAVDESDLI